MSEKRLASSGDSFVGLTEMQIVDLLNTLTEENEQLKSDVEYWKNKAMILLKQMRIMTTRMTEAEVKEFNKELEDD